MAATYTPIATQTLTNSSTITVSFTSIPSTYTDLVLIVSAKVTTAGANNYGIQFNSDTGTNYSRTLLNGSGTSASSSRNSNQNYVTMGVVANSGQAESIQITQIMNYANTTTYKTALNRCAWVEGTQAVVGLWRSTSAINRIDIFLEQTYGTNYFTSGATFTLYGIKAA